MYQYSEKLESVRELLAQKFRTVLTQTQSIDAILAAAEKKQAKLTTEEKATVTKSLDEVVKGATLVHDELARDYAQQIELLHQQGKTLRLLQNMQLQADIDEVHFVMHFLKQFQVLFKQIDDSEP